MTEDLIRELKKKIKAEALKEDFNAEMLIDLLGAYQLLEPYRGDEIKIDDDEISNLSDIDIKIMDHIACNGSSTLTNITSKIMLPRATISYRINKLIRMGILIKIPTIIKDKPIAFTDKGQEIFLKIQGLE